jgi:hypothetical protein
MEDYEQSSEGFSIPKQFLAQLDEYSVGYMLFVCNERGEIFLHDSYDNPIIKLGLVNFAEMHVNAAQKVMRNIAIEEEQNNYEDNDED